MNEKVLSTLEYHKIILQLVEHADSEPGKKLCRELIPVTDISEIRTAQSETRDALSRLFKQVRRVYVLLIIFTGNSSNDEV